jgi:hypothetical protein
MVVPLPYGVAIFHLLYAINADVMSFAGNFRASAAPSWSVSCGQLLDSNQSSATHRSSSMHHFYFSATRKTYIAASGIEPTTSWTEKYGALTVLVEVISPKSSTRTRTRNFHALQFLVNQSNSGQTHFKNSNFPSIFSLVFSNPQQLSQLQAKVCV